MACLPLLHLRATSIHPCGVRIQQNTNAGENDLAPNLALLSVLAYHFDWLVSDVDTNICRHPGLEILLGRTKQTFCRICDDFVWWCGILVLFVLVAEQSQGKLLRAEG